MFDTVLIANRGEIAVRVTRTLRALGIRSVAVFSDADAHGRHVHEADVAVRLGPAPARESYLSIERVLAAAHATGAQAIHPGYGFLAENADFARACAAAGMVFIGPSVDAIAVMGDKIRAKLAVGAAGVPVVPGLTEPGLSDEALLEGAAGVGYPLLIKPSAGGGGKGMHVVTDPARLREEIASARREAAASFGDDTLFLERYLQRPRHIEVQVLADAHGTTVHLGERECSLQRRHQKVIEEAPSVLLDEAGRARIGAAAVETARSVGYTGAGTVEFIVAADAPEEFFFMEMNTRLQVEHPVTEMITGLDLVEQQLRVAAGERLGLDQQAVTLRGHAVEARLYAENPARGFLPTGGRVLGLRAPDGPGVRVDSALAGGEAVGTSYDPMLAKVIAWGRDRPEALARLDAALAQTAVLGVTTNTAFLRGLLAHPDVVAGRLDTGLIERELDGLLSDPVPPAVYAAWGAVRFGALTPRGPVVDPWEVPSGWRQTGPAETVWRVAVGGADVVEVGVVPGHVRVAGGPALPFSLRDGSFAYDGSVRPLEARVDGPVTWLWLEGRTHEVRELAAERAGGTASAGDGALRSPMPGAVVAVRATVGDSVAAGDPLLVVEAMKMEHALLAPFDGTVAAVAVAVGDQVVVGQVLAVVAPIEEGP